MQRVLLVESDKHHAQSISAQLSNELGIRCTIASSSEEAQAFVEGHRAELLAVIINLKFCLDNYSPFENIPTIVITEEIPLEPRQMLLARHVIDYVANYRGHNLEYLLQLLKRIKFAKHLKVMVVDDERVVRNLVRHLLTNKGFHVLEAENGEAALQRLSEHPDTKLMLVDSQMPRMSGFELLQNLRLEHSKNQLAVIGMADEEQEHELVKFLRFGANDCLSKPLRVEEFHVRVMQNLHLVEVFQEIADLSRRDHLTNLFNRRHFYDVATKIYENYKRGTIDIAIAMIDIDNFKEINDTYGHAAGDLVLIHLGKILSRNLRSTDVICRFGGEEFCVLSTGLTARHHHDVFERLRKKVESSTVRTAQAAIRFTVSIGLTSRLGDNLTDMIAEADALLYQAKKQGKNKVVADAFVA